MSEFNQTQKGLMPLVVPVIWLMGYIIYRIGKRSTRGTETEYDRWGVWYWVMAGAVCGKWLFHAAPNATLHTVVGAEEYPSYGVMSFGIFLGLFIMVMIQEIGRVWHENPNYSSPAYVEAQEDMINKDTMTKQTNIKVNDMHDFGPQLFTGYDKIKDQYRRRRVSRILLVCMFYLATIEGLFICFWQDKTPAGLWVLVIMSWVLRLLDSIIIYGALIHGMFHVDERTRCHQLFVGYGAITLYWCITVLLSMVPIFVDMPPDQAEAVISHAVFALFTGICAGILIWYWAHFMFMTGRSVNKKYTKWRLLAFLLVGCTSGITSLFV